MNLCCHIIVDWSNYLIAHFNDCYIDSDSFNVFCNFKTDETAANNNRSLRLERASGSPGK